MSELHLRSQLALAAVLLIPVLLIWRVWVFSQDYWTVELTISTRLSKTFSFHRYVRYQVLFWPNWLENGSYLWISLAIVLRQFISYIKSMAKVFESGQMKSHSPTSAQSKRYTDSKLSSSRHQLMMIWALHLTAFSLWGTRQNIVIAESSLAMHSPRLLWTKQSHLFRASLQSWPLKFVTILESHWTCFYGFDVYRWT